MQNYPHHYKVNAEAQPEGSVHLKGEGLPAMISAPPTEFGGPGDQWSPETLLVASVADCFVLSFRAIARASKLEWTSLNCEVVGTLERDNKQPKFTEFTVTTALSVPPETNEDRAHRLLQKAEETCLITNSLSSRVQLNASVKSS